MVGKPRLRKREIALALGAGLLAAGGGAAVLEIMQGDKSAPVAVTGNNLSYRTGPFTAISTVGPQDVVVTQGDKFEIHATGSSQALQGLKVTVRDGTLLIQPGGGFHGFGWQQFGSATFYVTLPRLEGVSVAGSGSTKVERADGPFFSGAVVGPGELTVAAMKVDRANFSIAGSGQVSATGSARDTRAMIRGSGDITARGLHSETAAVVIGGSGDVALTVDGNARVAVAGSGDVTIAGRAHCTVSKRGSGSVSCANSSPG